MASFEVDMILSEIPETLKVTVTIIIPVATHVQSRAYQQPLIINS